MPGLLTQATKLNPLVSGFILTSLLALSACEGEQSGNAQSQEVSQPQELSQIDTTSEIVPPKIDQETLPPDWLHKQSTATDKIDEQYALEVADLAVIKFHRAHPRACYDRFHKVWQEGKVDKAFEMLTPLAQQQIAGIVLLFVSSAEPVPDDALNPHDFVYDGSSERGSGVAHAISDLLGKRSVETVDKLYKKLWPDDFDDLNQEEQDAWTRKVFYEAANAMGPPDIFIKDVIWMIDELSKADTGIKRTILFNGLTLTKHELIEVEIDGDRARGWYPVPGRDQQYSVDFVRDELGWQIDQILPYGYNVPGIGYYRDAEGVVHLK